MTNQNQTTGNESESDDRVYRYDELYDNDMLDLLVDGHHGIYVPQCFVRNFDLSKWNGIDDDDIRECDNPDNEFYWESWDNILQNAEYVDDNGHRWGLWQNNDLWVYRTDIEIDWDSCPM